MHIPKCILYKIPIDLEVEPVINLHVNKPKKRCRHKSKSKSCKCKHKRKSKRKSKTLAEGKLKLVEAAKHAAHIAACEFPLLFALVFTLLQQKTSQGSLQQAVLIPLGM